MLQRFTRLDLELLAGYFSVNVTFVKEKVFTDFTIISKVFTKGHKLVGSVMDYETQQFRTIKLL